MREDEERDRKMLLTPDGHGKVDKALALNRLLTAARRAGAEEMREKCAGLVDNYYLKVKPDEGVEDILLRLAGEMWADDPDAKGGEHASL